MSMFKNIIMFSGKSFSIMHFFVFVSFFCGIFLIEWNLYWAALSILIYYIFGNIGMSLMLHRYWAHKSFQFKSDILEKIFTFISLISGRGSPLAWVHIHRMHHAHADTEQDPHKPENFSLFSFRKTYIKEIKFFLIRDLMTKEHKFYHEYYFLIIFLWCVFLISISPYLFYFAWIVPVFFNQVSQDLWNYFSHIDTTGYRNFKTSDNSRNIIWLWPFILGEAWHNNHHHNSKNSSLKIKNYELDPVGFIISFIKK